MTSKDDPSRLYQWVLLICSLVTLCFLIASAISELFSNEWRGHQRRYKTLLVRKAAGEVQRRAADEFPIELRQVTVPGLGAVDRCIACHLGVDDPRMADSPEPYRTHAGKIIQDHPVDQFGCTICHNGQGSAVNYRDAHEAGIDWGYPMLPLKYTAAACASCHDPLHLQQGDGRLLALGQQLFQERSCGSCHKLNGRGGSLSLPLDDEGMKTIHQFPLQRLQGEHTTWNWLEQHFRDPQALVAGSLMKKTPLDDREVQAITVYTLSLRSRTLPQEYIARDKVEQAYQRWRPGPPDGASLYRQYCFACHGAGDESVLDDQFNRFVPAVRGASLLRAASRDFYIANISRGRPGTPMPAWSHKSGGLNEAEIAAIVDFLRKDVPATIPNAPAPAPTARGDAQKGAGLFESLCNECHRISGEGPASDLANSAFQETASDDFIVETIRNGRDNTLMQPFQEPGGKGLKEDELADLLAYVRQLGKRRQR